jgi:hypothetical protein
LTLNMNQNAVFDSDSSPGNGSSAASSPRSSILQTAINRFIADANGHAQAVCLDQIRRRHSSPLSSVGDKR